MPVSQNQLGAGSVTGAGTTVGDAVGIGDACDDTLLSLKQREIHHGG